MPVLGTGGRMRLRREPAEPCVISKDDIDLSTGLISGVCSGFWNGDEVKICSTNGEPIFDTGQDQQIDTVATYFNDPQVLPLMENRDHITALNDTFYKTSSESYPDGKTGNNARFYYSGPPGTDPPVPPTPGGSCVTGYICIDALGRLKLYSTRCAGLACCGDTEIKFLPEADLLVWDSITIEHENFDWEILCGIQDFSLELDAPNVETTSVGEKFGESVKSLVNGGGNCNFFVDKVCPAAGTDDSTELLRLLLMTEKGCKAEAEFYIVQNSGDCSGPVCDGPVPGTLFYKADILVTQTAINVRPTELVAGTCNWVTTGEIQLLQAPPT